MTRPRSDSTAKRCGGDRRDGAADVREIDDDIRRHRVWQDVYHVPADDLVLYVKVQADVVTEFK